MRKILFVALFAFLLLSELSSAQSVSGGCFFMGGPILDSWGCSTVVVRQSSAVSSGFGGAAGISGLLGTNFEASGEVTGAPGGPTSTPCQIFDYGASGAPLSFTANAAPASTGSP